MKKIELKRERMTIRLYIVSILILVVAVVIEPLIGSSETLLVFSLGFGALSALFLILAIDRARKRTVTHVYSNRGGFMGTSTARTDGIIGAIILLLPLITLTAMSVSYTGYISLADLVPGLILLAGGIVALLGALTYKVTEEP